MPKIINLTKPAKILPLTVELNYGNGDTETFPIQIGMTKTDAVRAFTAVLISASERREGAKTTDA